MDWDLKLSHYKQRPFKEVVKELAEFVWIRIQETQLNQCGVCMDSHSRDAAQSSGLVIDAYLRFVIGAFGRCDFGELCCFPGFCGTTCRDGAAFVFQPSARGVQPTDHRLCEVFC